MASFAAMNARLFLLLFCLASGIASPPLRAETRWYAIHLGKDHIGHMQRSRSEVDGAIETRSELVLILQRNGERLPVESAEWTRESADGEPLAFSSRFATTGTLAAVEARVEAGTVTARIEQGGQRSEKRFPWPEGAVLNEGQRRAMKPLLDGETVRSDVLAFDPASLNALPLSSARLAMETVELEGGPAQLLRIRQVHGPAGAGVRSELWVDPETGDARQMRLPALGLELLLRACSRECATAPPVAADVLASTLLRAPRAISQRERQRPLYFSLRAGDLALTPLGGIPGQRLGQADAAGVARLRIDPEGAADQPPTDADLAPARWLQSDDPEVRAMAESAVGRSRSAARRMYRLQEAVRRHIEHKSLRVGYASAAEVIELREGDCTEHAVLLAALARAQGIPARVVTGLAYAPGYAGRQDVFVPHAWVMAWIDDRWKGYDAALPAFGAAHIGLAMGDGEPFDFYSGLELLGRLELVEVSTRKAGGGP
ncbi:transglutaminase-like domain-containing protein [Pseudomarimonas salicorniae]|uniref:Transglutaminase-like domain-containing protein n=1 Tax=Pseudomarimonas salicorniae TaxID=2933270 RepID=A0ABT0GIH5_9GAMM|nr:transglutaminase-like domain-containing protein [Lysobacter sp. CAU 1642]MCK7594152.1 transglutaminase-like domain-containing protein [Lysobacter sp. CAU 1642]